MDKFLFEFVIPMQGIIYLLNELATAIAVAVPKHK